MGPENKAIETQNRYQVLHEAWLCPVQSGLFTPNSGHGSRYKG